MIYNDFVLQAKNTIDELNKIREQLSSLHNLIKEITKDPLTYENNDLSFNLSKKRLDEMMYSLLKTENLSLPESSPIYQYLLKQGMTNIDHQLFNDYLLVHQSSSINPLSDFDNCIKSYMDGIAYSLLTMSLLISIEDSLEEVTMDSDDSQKEISSINIRSLKHSYDINSYTDDFKNLSLFLTRLGQIMLPSSPHPFMVQRFESGSLKIKIGSFELEIDIIEKLFRTIVDAYREWKLIPADYRKAIAEAEKAETEAKQARINVAESEYNFILNKTPEIAKLTGLDPQNAEEREKIQQMLIPAVKYIENNPEGSIGNYSYNLGKTTGYLETHDGNPN